MSMENNKPIFIIGYMASGKTTFGEALAKRLNRKFYDLDREIEKCLDKKISEIFQSEGESRFREIEAEILKKIGSESNVVVSCGGGTPCFYDNLEYMRGRGVTVWLDTQVEIIYKRIEEQNEGRPLVNGLQGEKLRLKITRQLAERLPHYVLSQIKWEGDRLEDEMEIQDNIDRFLAKYRGF